MSDGYSDFKKNGMFGKGGGIESLSPDEKEWKLRRIKYLEQNHDDTKSMEEIRKLKMEIARINQG